MRRSDQRIAERDVVVSRATLDEPKELDRRTEDRGSDPIPALAVDIVSTSMDLVHDRSSKPRPTSICSAGANCGLGESCLRAFPLREPIDLRPFSLLADEDGGLSC